MTLIEISYYVGIAVGIFSILGTIAGVLYKMKTNDLKHIDDKLDEIKDSVKSVHTKLDDHIQYHLEHKL